MEETFLTYRQFNDMALAQQTARLLTENGIENLIADGTKFFDASFANNAFAANINLKIKADDFIKADEILGQLFANDLDDVDKDYYLFSFSDAELLEIIEKPDEWGHFDYQLAKKILSDKGKSVDAKEIALLKFRRINELAEPEAAKDIWILLGYIASVIGGFFGILTGFIGVVAGLAMATWKKTLPDGQRVYVYDEQSRKHGKIMIVIASVSSIIFFLLRVMFFVRRV